MPGGAVSEFPCGAALPPMYKFFLAVHFGRIILSTSIPEVIHYSKGEKHACVENIDGFRNYVPGDTRNRRLRRDYVDLEP
jgi:hypothetical protein